MEFEAAFRALFQDFTRAWQHRSTLRTARHGALGRHLQRSRPEGVLPCRSIAGFLSGLPAFFSAILISVLSVFAVGQVALLYRRTLSR
jgi:hypothetical protein